MSYSRNKTDREEEALAWGALGEPEGGVLPRIKKTLSEREVQPRKASRAQTNRASRNRPLYRIGRAKRSTRVRYMESTEPPKPNFAAQIRRGAAIRPHPPRSTWKAPSSVLIRPGPNLFSLGFSTSTHAS